MLSGETMLIYEPGVGMELTSSVQANYWLSNVAYVNNETITPKKNGILIGTNFRLIFVVCIQFHPAECLLICTPAQHR